MDETGVITYEAYKSSPDYLAMLLGTACLAQIEGETGRILHNHVWKTVEMLVGRDFRPEMFREIAKVVIKYSEITKADILKRSTSND